MRPDLGTQLLELLAARRSYRQWQDDVTLERERRGRHALGANATASQPMAKQDV
jgi:hypothetical protein